MRLIKSPIGSLKAIADPSLPARLDQARDQPFRAEIPQRDAAELMLAIERARPTRHLAPIADTRRRRVARQFGELQCRGEPLFHWPLLVLSNRFQTRAPAEKFL